MVVSDFPVGWKLVISLVQGCLVLLAWKWGVPENVLMLTAGLFGIGTITKAVTDSVKIKQNGNGKAPVPCDTTGAPDNRGAS
jgi:hypothetical protein